jgi:hypothetical protein
MKKFFAVIVVLLFVFVSIFVVKQTQISIASASATTSGYAKVKTNDCYLLKDFSQNAESKYFLLEQSYFVKVVDNYDDVYYVVQYLDFEGYVEKSKVNFVEEYPENPYLSGITFDIYSLGNVCMRSSPKTVNDDKNILCTIPAGTKDLLYYGKIAGEEAIDSLGNIWYYCAYQNENGNVFKGYVYAPLTSNLSNISCSDENLTLVNISNFTPVNSLLYLNLSTKNMLIVITAIPSIAVILLLTVPSKIKKNVNVK